MSYGQLEKYLKFLISNGLLQVYENEGKESYLITDKGKRFVECYKQAMVLIKGTANDKYFPSNFVG